MIQKNNGKVLFIFTQKMNYMPFSHGIDLAVGDLVRLYSRSCARRKIILAMHYLKNRTTVVNMYTCKLTVNMH